jgi:PIN domain-containing protein
MASRMTFTSTGITTLFYLLARARSPAAARRAVERTAATFGIAVVDEAVVRRALALTWSDFEDSVCAGAAEACACEALVTRDPSGFPESPIPVLDPPTALALLSGKGPETVGEVVTDRDHLFSARGGLRVGHR